MKIVVIGGTGALGGLFGCLWAEAGHDVTHVGRSLSTADLLQREGLLITHLDGSVRTHWPKVVTSFDEIDSADLVALTVKSYDTVTALESARNLIDAGAVILSLQNGIRHQRLIQEKVPDAQCFFGVTLQASTRLGPNHLLHASRGLTQIGQIHRDADASMLLANDLSSEDAPMLAAIDIEKEIWNKLCLNLCTMPASVIYRLKASQLPDDPKASRMMKHLLTEGVQVALAKGIDIDERDRWETALAFLRKAGEGKSSMLQDFESGKQLESDAILGALIEEGERLGVPTPHLAAVYALLSPA